MTRDTAYILCRDAESNLVYSPWLQQLGMPVQVVDQLSVGWRAPDDCAILISHNQYQHAHVAALRSGMDQQIPTLVLADGILEYRNSWENPQLPDGSIYRPVIGHKLACIGKSQARVIEKWGNFGKCEVVGIPRLDQTASERVDHSIGGRPPSNADEFRLLVMTARQPGFTPEQLASLKQCLRDVQSWVASQPSVEGKKVALQWRLTGQLAQEMGIETPSIDTGGRELLEQLRNVDAVLSSPSTAALEAMLMGVPVALIDYFRCPLYVPSPWSLRTAEDIPFAVTEMANPATGKTDYQRLILADSLEWESPATPRLIKLVHEMVAIAERCRLSAEPLRFPSNILADPQSGERIPSSVIAQPSSFDNTPAEDVHSTGPPNLATTAESEAIALSDRLRIELSHAETQLLEQQSLIAEKDRRLRRSGRLNDRILAKNDELNRKLSDQRKDHRRSDRRQRKLQQRVDALISQHREAKQKNQELVRESGKNSRQSKRYRQLLEKRNRQLAQRNRNAVRLNQQRKQVAAKFMDTRQQLNRTQTELASLHAEWERLESHWLLGYPIRWIRSWNNRRLSNDTRK